jgi:hypothetical protein
MAVATSTAILGAAALGTGASLYGANQAAKAQKSAANRAADAQREALTRQEELQEPFRQAGIAAQDRTLTLLGLEGGDTSSPDFGKYARDFGMSDFEADPGYGFRMKEGMKALENSAAARGGLLSGTTLKGVQRFGQDLASTEYQNAFNRYQANRASQLNPLQSLYGGGQTSTNALTSAYGQGAAGIGNAMMAGGQARASGYANMSNAVTSGLSTGANLYMQRPLYEAMANYYSRPNYSQVSNANVGGPGGY